MKSFSLKIFSNRHQISRSTLQSIIDWALDGGINLTVDFENVNFSSIPFIDYNYKSDIYDRGVIMGNNLYGIDPSWYDENISSKATKYDIVCFVVNQEQWQGKMAAGWRYDKNLGPIELQITASSQSSIMLQYLFHELSHSFYEIAGCPDRTHEFYYNGDTQCVKAVKAIVWPETKYASDDPIWWEKLINFLISFRKMTENQTPLVDSFCLAIQKHEGWYEGSRSWRNNNPGNIRYVGQAKAVGSDKNNFAIFANYQDGFDCLKNMIKNAATGLSRVYFPDDTIKDFFSKYAPSYDNNDSLHYAEVVADALGVSVDFKIKNLI